MVKIKRRRHRTRLLKKCLRETRSNKIAKLQNEDKDLLRDKKSLVHYLQHLKLIQQFKK